MQMKIGGKLISHCTDCPAHKWNGYKAGTGDLGYMCEFGCFSHRDVDQVKIASNCPLKNEVALPPPTLPQYSEDPLNPLIRLATEMGHMGGVRIYYEYGDKVTIEARHNSSNKVRNMQLSMNAIYSSNIDMVKHACIELSNYFKQQLKQKVQAYVAEDTEYPSSEHGIPLSPSFHAVSQGLVPPPPNHILNIDMAEAEKKVFAQVSKHAQESMLKKWQVNLGNNKKDS